MASQPPYFDNMICNGNTDINKQLKNCKHDTSTFFLNKLVKSVQNRWTVLMCMQSLRKSLILWKEICYNCRLDKLCTLYSKGSQKLLISTHGFFFKLTAMPGLAWYDHSKSTHSLGFFLHQFNSKTLIKGIYSTGILPQVFITIKLRKKNTLYN